jgi:hypothetical protein
MILSYNKMGNVGAFNLSCVLPLLNIIDLDISYNNINFEGLVYIINALLHSNKQVLKKLCLSGNDGGSEVASALCYLLEKNQTITTLHLDEMVFTSIEKGALVSCISNNPLSKLTVLTGFDIVHILQLNGFVLDGLNELHNSPKNTEVLAFLSSSINLRIASQDNNDNNIDIADADHKEGDGTSVSISRVPHVSSVLVNVNDLSTSSLCDSIPKLVVSPKRRICDVYGNSHSTINDDGSEQFDSQMTNSETKITKQMTVCDVDGLDVNCSNQTISVSLEILKNQICQHIEVDFNYLLYCYVIMYYIVLL